MEIQGSTLQQKIDISAELEVTFASNDLFLPPVKQIGQSLSETKEHYIQNGKISVLPSALHPPLSDIRDVIVKWIKVNDGFSTYDLITKRSFATSFVNDKEPTGFIFMSKSLPVVLDIHALCGRPNAVIGDVFISLPYQPTLVITFVNSYNDTNDSSIYNTAVARGLCMSLGRFMDEGFKTAFGVMSYQELTDESKFTTRLEEIIKGSTKYVTYSSLAMHPKKYDKVLTAFMASLSVTKSVCSSSDGPDSCLRFLTKDQCVALVENINKMKVDISSGRGTGSTVLMAEAARRLSHLGKTLFVCEKIGDCENYRNKNPDMKVCSIGDREAAFGLDYSDYTCVVDETPIEGTNLQRPDSVKGVLWVHHPLPEPMKLDEEASFKSKHYITEDTELVPVGTKRRRVSNDMTRLSLGHSEEGDQKKETDGDTERRSEDDPTNKKESDDPMLSFNASHGKENITIKYTVMEFDRARVNTKHCHINANDELVNIPGQIGQKMYKRYWGTCSTVHIPAKSATLETVPAQYWEVHADIEPEYLDDQRTWGPVLEFGVVEESRVDKRVWISQDHRYWCLTVEGCKVHFPQYCVRISREVKDNKEIRCYPQHIANMQITPLKYGVLVDVHRDLIAFYDLVNGKHLETVITDFKETLLPMFALKHIPKNNFNIKLKLLSGKKIDMTDEKKSLIMNAYKKL